MTSDAPDYTAGPATGGPGLGRYLVGAADPAADPAALSDALTGDPRVRILRRPTPDLITIETTADVAEELRSSGAGLLVEPDAELQALPPVGPAPIEGETR